MNSKRSIPIVKPIIDEKEIELVSDVLRSGMLAEGSYNKKFESEFAKFTGAKYAISVCNGTSALIVALEALGIKPGDEVITVGFTFIASANSILHVGAIPIFVDINPKTWNIDIEEVKKAITPKTKAIMPIHIFGLPADMESLKKIAKEHNLLIIEDACQAHGAKVNNEHVGTIGDIGCFSLYATKNLMAGEGGIIVTNNEKLANRCRSLKNHGREAGKFGGYDHYRVGFNFRMTDFNAAIAYSQLNKLPKFLDIRKKNAELYKKLLSEIEELETQEVEAGIEHCNYIFSCRLKTDKYKVDEIVKFLRDNGIGSRPIYSNPVYLQPAYKDIKNWKWSEFFDFPDYKNLKLPVTEKIAATHFEIPVNQAISLEDVEYVCLKLKQFFNKK